MFVAFTPDSTLAYTNGNILIGSASGAQAIITGYEQGVVRDILVDYTGSGIQTHQALQSQHLAVQVHKQQRHVQSLTDKYPQYQLQTKVLDTLHNLL